MNRRKQLTLLVLGMIIILPILTTGCFKKGEDDPFVSLQTRKARMTGTWNFAETSSTIRRTIGDLGNVSIITTNTDNRNWTQRVVFEDTDSVANYRGTVRDAENFIRFDKYGNFEQNFIYEYPEEFEEQDGELIIRYRTVVTERIRGTWNFLGKIEDEFKNKERIALIYINRSYQKRVEKTEIYQDAEEGQIPVPELVEEHNITERYANGEVSTIWQITGLKNKEIRMQQQVSNAYLETISDAIQSITETGVKTQVLKK